MSLYSKRFADMHSKPERTKDSASVDISAAVAKTALERRANIFPKLQRGFTFEGTGRSGYVYFKRDGRMLEIYWEMSGVPQYDILLSADGLTHWCFPDCAPVSAESQFEIRASLRAWLDERKMRADL